MVNLWSLALEYMKVFSQRERPMLAGLFLSKFDREGLKPLEFSDFSEAYNTMGYALGGKPASIKNSMQEFDPLFPNSRQGWHKRKMHDHCREACECFGQLTLPEFYRLLSPLLQTSVVPPLPDGMDELAALDEGNFENESLSKRLITGAAAEGFFESSFPKLADFSGHTLTNLTRFGCGFDSDESICTVDLITDLLHHLHSLGEDPFSALEKARGCFESEARGTALQIAG